MINLADFLFVFQMSPWCSAREVYTYSMCEDSNTQNKKNFHAVRYGNNRISFKNTASILYMPFYKKTKQNRNSCPEEDCIHNVDSTHTVSSV